MNTIKRLWKFWCNKVDTHNSNLDYVNQEESWSYYTPLTAIFYGFASGFILSFFAQPFIYISLGVFVTIMFSLALYLNWIFNA